MFDRDVNGIVSDFVVFTVCRIMDENAYANMHRIFYSSVYSSFYCFAKNL
ncbi:Uncharacterised protein [Burkholderia pseudomallei]|nr:Uncharacterised protein [Burkholderia pseudomallei]